jgi:hypothetical protein
MCVCMYVCVCVCVCMYVCVYVCVCVCVCVASFNMGARWIKVVNITHVAPLISRLGGPQTLSGRFEEEKNLLLLTG